MFFFFLLYGVVTIIFCFAMSTLFATASIATAFGALFYFLAFVPFFFTGGYAPCYQCVSRGSDEDYAKLTYGAKIGLCFLPQTCMGIGTVMWNIMETSGTGVSLANMHNQPTGMAALLLLLRKCS